MSSRRREPTAAVAAAVATAAAPSVHVRQLLSLGLSVGTWVKDDRVVVTRFDTKTQDYTKKWGTVRYKREMYGNSFGGTYSVVFDDKDPNTNVHGNDMARTEQAAQTAD
jgi:hypothetical protein